MIIDYNKKRQCFLIINALVTVLNFYGHDLCDQKMGAYVTGCTHLDFFLPMLTFSSLFSYVAPIAVWPVPSVDSLIDFWPNQFMLFQVLVIFLVLALHQPLLSHTVFRAMSKKCGF